MTLYYKIGNVWGKAWHSHIGDCSALPQPTSTVHMKPKQLYAFISVYDSEKTGELIKFARRLIQEGYIIVSSGGTASYLKEYEVPVTTVESITELGSMFKGRVKTIHPAIASGMIATSEMLPELEQHKFIWFDVVYITFYPLARELAREGSTLLSCVNETDVGGPTNVQAACKGGDRIVLVEPSQIELVINWLDEGRPNEVGFKFMLETRALDVCAEYGALVASIRHHKRPADLN